MRKRLICVLMTTLLLSGCGQAGVSAAEQLALTIRGELLAASACSAQAAVTADYGRRVYQYTMAVAGEGDAWTLTLSAPETVAGLIAHLDGEGSQLEYDGMWVETGPLDGDGLTPVSAVPALLETARAGYITACALEDALLRVDCGDPEGTPGTGLETSLWFSPETHALVRGAIFVDGFQAVLCEFSDFAL